MTTHLFDACPALVFVDLEASGLYPDSRLVEVGLAALAEDGAVHSASSRIRTGCRGAPSRRDGRHALRRSVARRGLRLTAHRAELSRPQEQMEQAMPRFLRSFLKRPEAQLVSIMLLGFGMLVLSLGLIFAMAESPEDRFQACLASAEQAGLLDGRRADAALVCLRSAYQVPAARRASDDDASLVMPPGMGTP